MMKRDSKPASIPTAEAKRPTVKRPVASTSTPSGKAGMKRRISEQKIALGIGGLVIVAVYFGLELTRPAPPTSKEPIVFRLDPKAPAREVKSGISVKEDEGPSSHSTIPETAKGEVVGAVQSSAAAAMPPASVAQDEIDAASFGKEPVLVLTDLDSRRDAAIQRDKDLFKRAIDSRAWTAYREFLARSIDAGFAKLAKGQGVNRFDAVWSEPALYQAFLRWQVIGRLSESGISRNVTDSYSGEFLIWLCSNPAAMEEFLITIKPEDDGGKVLEFLTNAWPNIPGMMDKYFPLALACAVVFDREVGISNPVGGEYGEKTVVEPLSRMMWYIKNNEKGLLAAPVHRSTARDLVWVVCAPVSTSELDWSLDKMHLSRKHWGNAYGMIEYLMERAVNGLDPYKEYTFSEILKEGGICGDQSYFCTNTARAQGIPAMTLSGETDLGGHAWVALKITSDDWTTGVGRIGGVSKGQTGNPQTGQTITEQEVQSWDDRAHKSPATTLSVARHLWLAGYFEAAEKNEDQAAAVRLANQIGPSFSDTWSALYALLRHQMKLAGEPAKPSNLDDWKAFAKSMRQEFKDNPRMAQLAAAAEMEYIFPYEDQGDATRALLRERRRIERNSGEQKDLIAESLKREAELISKRGDSAAKQDISRLYDSALRKYGGSITGFKMMAEDYFGYFKDDPELARKAARDIELAFKRVVETGTKDWFRANTESSIYKMICGYYRTAGDEERAIMLEKRFEVLLERAKRSAL
ncbi:MAG: hypothetical protein V4689_09135 [Verrucomicrobiota bacterium]